MPEPSLLGWSPLKEPNRRNHQSEDRIIVIGATRFRDVTKRLRSTFSLPKGEDGQTSMKILMSSALMILVSFSAGIILSSATHPPAMSNVERIAAMHRNVRAERDQCHRELDVAYETVEALDLATRTSEELLDACLARLTP